MNELMCLEKKEEEMMETRKLNKHQAHSSVLVRKRH